MDSANLSLELGQTEVIQSEEEGVSWLKDLQAS